MFRCFGLFSTILILATICVFAAGPPVPPNAGHQQLLKLIPDPLPQQFAAQGETSFYGPENLYQYMDGGADIFVLYGVQTMLHQDFRVKDVEITADIFDMGSSESAFGMYAAERSPGYRFVKTGAEGYQDEGILNFLQDRYYVKLAGFGEGADAVLANFAQSISARIGANSAFPALLSQLPAEHRTAHSEQYMPKDPLGHPFLAPAYVASYAFSDQESKLFVTVAHNDADAQQRLEQLEQHFRSNGESKPAPELGESAIRVKNSFEGSAIARTKGRYLILLMNPVAGAEQLLKDTANSLK